MLRKFRFVLASEVAIAIASFAIGWAVTGSPWLGLIIAAGSIVIAAPFLYQQVVSRITLRAVSDRVASQGGRLTLLGDAVEAASVSAQQRDERLAEQLGVLTTRVPYELPEPGSEAAEIVKEIVRGNRQMVDSVDSLLQLSSLLPRTVPMAPAGGYGGSPEFLLELVRQIERRKPRLIVEMGSGLSTVWIGLALKRWVPGGRLVSLEHHPHYLGLTQSEVDAHGLSSVVDLRLAPLDTDNATGQQWYAASGWADLQEIDVLVVDGPPGRTGPLARYPALPLLHDRLRSDAIVIVDDAGRPDELEVLRRWKQEHGVKVTQIDGARPIAIALLA